jgi:hypothetical protein
MNKIPKQNGSKSKQELCLSMPFLRVCLQTFGTARPDLAKSANCAILDPANQAWGWFGAKNMQAFGVQPSLTSELAHYYPRYDYERGGKPAY